MAKQGRNTHLQRRTERDRDTHTHIYTDRENERRETGESQSTRDSTRDRLVEEDKDTDTNRIDVSNKNLGLRPRDGTVDGHTPRPGTQTAKKTPVRTTSVERNGGSGTGVTVSVVITSRLPNVPVSHVLGSKLTLPSLVCVRVVHSYECVCVCECA